MDRILESDTRYLVEGYGPHLEKRFEVWEKGTPDKLEWWTSSRAAAVEHFNLVKDLPRYERPKADWGWLNG